MELGNLNASLGLTSSVIFAQQKEKCHLFSLWTIINMDIKLLTTQCKRTMFLSLFRVNVPSVRTRNIISAMCVQNKNDIITRQRVSMFVEAPPLTYSILTLEENTQSVITQMYESPVASIKHVESNTQHQTCSMTCAQNVQNVYSKQSINQTCMISSRHANKNKHTHSCAQRGARKKCVLYARVCAIIVPCQFNCLMHKETRETQIRTGARRRPSAFGA